mgnify:FL=1|nr:MAG TPA: putative tail component [Caudoviricetes sp.]
MQDIAKEIAQALADFSSEIEEDLEQIKEDTADEAVQELKATSPRGRRGKYAKGWRKTKQGTAIVINNREYRLTHLLEKGHAKRNGGRTQAQPHIKIVEERVIKRFEDNVIRKVQR